MIRSTKTSLEYVELSGLSLALNRLNLTPEIHRDQEWAYVTTWLSARIKYLTDK